MGHNPNPGWSVGGRQVDRIAEFRRQSGRRRGAGGHWTCSRQNREIHGGVHNHIRLRVRWRVRMDGSGGACTSLELELRGLIEITKVGIYALASAQLGGLGRTATRSNTVQVD